jgi:surface protein
MKSLTKHINEKLVLNNNTKIRTHYYKPTSKDELKELVKKLIEERGNDADLNDIDTSNITNMSQLFQNSKFNGDISNWNVSNVEDMSFMFSAASKFNGDISKWDVSKVKDMYCMFSASFFNGDISEWKIAKGCNTDRIFYMGRISKWNKPKRLK